MKNGKIKIISYILAAIIAIAFCVGGGILLARVGKRLDKNNSSIDSVVNSADGSSDDTTDTSSGDNSSEDDSSEDDSSNVGDPGEETKADVYQYTTELQMEPGAELFAQKGKRPKLIFTCRVPLYLKTAAQVNVAADFTFTMALATREQFIKDDPYTKNVHWMDIWERGDYIYETMSASDLVEKDGEITFSLSTGDISYEKVNTQYVAAACYSYIENGTRIYNYTRYDENRSVAYLASEIVSEYVVASMLKEKLPCTEEVFEEAKTYLDESVDLSNGAAQPTYDKKYYEFSSMPEVNITLNVGETYTFNDAIEPNPGIVLYYCCVAMQTIDGAFVRNEDVISVYRTTISGISAGVAYFIIAKGGAASMVTVTVR